MRYYIIGIGGIAMSNLAVLLKKSGHTVSGSDTGTFEPALSLLKGARIPFSPRHTVAYLKRFKPDMVIVGNAIQRGNVLLEYILGNKMPYLSLPHVLRREVIAGKKAVVITGTSGKTTTTALTAWLFKTAGTRPSAFVGGIMQNTGTGIMHGTGTWVVIEGDEYSSSFEDMRSKFLSYMPYIGLVNNIGRDHVDLFPRMSDALASFRRFAELIPSDGTLLLNRNDKNASLLANVTERAVFFGGKKDVHAEHERFDAKGISFTAKMGVKKLGIIRSSLLGEHNVHNIVAALSCGLVAGLPFAKLAKGVASFKGVKRRLETIYENERIRVIDDFGHNPVKVKASLKALRTHFPESHVIVAFEPRTASSRRKAFQNQYPAAFSSADTVYIAEPFKKKLLKKKEVFSSEKLVAVLKRRKKDAYMMKTARSIVGHITKHLPDDRHIIIVTMSSGDFGGIREKLVAMAKKNLRRREPSL